MFTKESKKSHYSQEFKEQVLEIIQNSPKSMMTIAKEFGVSYPTILNWAKAKKPDPSQTQEETRKLKQEVDRLKKENEILKKAATFFAKQLD